MKSIARKSTPPSIIYKYRGGTNLEYTLDILINKRLWAGRFDTMNDPMEGIYDVKQLKQIGGIPIEKDYISQKSTLHFCSLSKVKNDMLMWSHYADGHKGIVIGIEEPTACKDPMNYVVTKDITYSNELHSFAMDDLTVRPMDIAMDILSHKYSMWQYEQEKRIFILDQAAHGILGSREGSFIESIKIKEIYVGVNASENLKLILETIANKCCPGITVQRTTVDELEIAGAKSVL